MQDRGLPSSAPSVGAGLVLSRRITVVLGSAAPQPRSIECRSLHVSIFSMTCRHSSHGSTRVACRASSCRSNLCQRSLSLRLAIPAPVGRKTRATGLFGGLSCHELPILVARGSGVGVCSCLVMSHCRQWLSVKTIHSARSFHQVGPEYLRRPRTSEVRNRSSNVGCPIRQQYNGIAS
ncbi:hypothetical protein L226DRAFT_115182 [Lentinus tigrinus ALCF2SS1-7]|uniref:Uncharacterized protein n=1 Tax=Lentinus tigrinus ALCF2SS1-6 TaxID=1328759 RepID=A0A5C2SS44_9APHY|nr:hypothetical protein L227DRAFT_355 [Lentinus tigrinus ALCF2SS1-6]RPD80614.1 hypothetical protein L226DRAFT_115182 [Lentinus tigrinus ALCF2SS1-7]